MKDRISTNRFILITAGFVMVTVAIYLILPVDFRDTGRAFTMMALIDTVYLLYFFPLIIRFFRKEAGGILASASVYYRGVTLFSLITAFSIYLLLVKNIRISLVWGIEFLAILLMLFYGYLAGFTAHHVKRVEEDEQEKCALLDTIRKKIHDMQITVTGRYPDNEEAVILINRLAEDMRYVSPSASDEAFDLENQMLQLLNQPVSEQGLVEKLKEIQTLYFRRKTVF